MMVGGDLSSMARVTLEAWAGALGTPVRLSGSDFTLAALRMMLSIEPALLGPDVRVELPAVDDRYVRDGERRVTNWRPLGTKSGPNLQWLRTIENLAGEAGIGWCLLLEPDTSPVSLCAADRVFALIQSHPKAWVIGAVPEETTLRGLDPRLHRHLNGVALYRVGEPQFVAFVEHVWKPSLLWLLQSEPNAAFDVLTSPDVWPDLPRELAQAWAKEAYRFVASTTLVNASATAPKRISDIAARAEADPQVWLLHGKTRT